MMRHEQQDGEGGEGSGTPAGPQGPRPKFVLVRPQMGENIGAAARAMWNFGLDRLALVAPRDGWPNPRAGALASGAGVVLDRAGVFEATAQAVAGCTMVYATTARGRGLVKPVLTPERAMEDARARLAAGQDVAFLFGPERTGLENDDIALAGAIVTVPVNPRFYSLNLAQCVLLLSYEFGRRAIAAPPERVELAGADWATRAEVQRLADHWEQGLEAAGHFFPETKAAPMKLSLRNFWGRMPLTRTDVQALHGILRRLQRGPHT